MLTLSRFWPTNIRHSINIACSILKLNICYLQIMFCYNSWLIRRVVNGLLFIIFFCSVFILFYFLQFADSMHTDDHTLYLGGQDWHNCNWTIFVGTCTNFSVHLLAIVHRFEDGPVEIDISQCSLAKMKIFESGTGSNPSTQHLCCLHILLRNLTFVMCFQVILVGIKWISWAMSYSLTDKDRKLLYP